jgi:hypothetical protein
MEESIKIITIKSCKGDEEIIRKSINVTIGV